MRAILYQLVGTGQKELSPPSGDGGWGMNDAVARLQQCHVMTRQG